MKALCVIFLISFQAFCGGEILITIESASFRVVDAQSGDVIQFSSEVAVTMQIAVDDLEDGVTYEVPAFGNIVVEMPSDGQGHTCFIHKME